MTRSLISGLALACLVAAPLSADPESFATPQDALDAMVTALGAADRNAVLAVFGDEAEDILSTGDAAEDDEQRRALLAHYREGYRMVPQEDGSIVLAFGDDGWPFPIPLVRQNGGWSFDIEAGREEVLARDIGLNEIDIIDLMDAYVDIQAAYRLEDHDGDGVMEFARQIISTSDTQHDGLFWSGSDSPLGDLFARANMAGFSDDDTDHAPEPYSGYYFRILTAQTDAAPGGAMSYLVNDHMLAGHALLAVPAAYGETGYNSFMVSENGVILEAILGDDTLAIAAEITAYDPGPDWLPVE